MNDLRALCPNCHREVVFVRKAFSARCPECGWRYGRSRDFESSDGAGATISVLKAVCWVLIVMVALAGISLAVAFAGCLLIFH